MTMILKGDEFTSASQPLSYKERMIQELLELKRNGEGSRWEDFSFERSQQALKDIPGNFSDAVEEERNT